MHRPTIVECTFRVGSDGGNRRPRPFGAPRFVRERLVRLRRKQHQTASSNCGSSSLISNHGALEPTKMCAVGRMVGASTSEPIATCTKAPSRTTEKRKDPQAR